MTYPESAAPLYPVRIAVIGSSTAAGHGADPAERSWVNQYRSFLKARHPDNEVVNLGLGGLQTFQLLPSGYKPPPARPLPDPERNITKALSYSPDAIIVNAPSNDAAAHYGLEEQLVNFDLLVHTGLAEQVPVWICTTQPRHFSAEQVAIQTSVKAAVLSRYQGLSLNFWDCLATADHLPDPSIDLGDGTHLNNKGHQLLYEQVCRKNLPEAIAMGKGKPGYWYQQIQSETVLPAGPQLFIPALDSGTVHIEVYNAQAELQLMEQTSLPCTIGQALEAPGQYWVKISGERFHKTLSWVKTRSGNA